MAGHVKRCGGACRGNETAAWCRCRSASRSGQPAHIDVLSRYLLLFSPAKGAVDSGTADELSRRLIGGDRRFLGVVQRLQLVLKLPGRGRAGQRNDTDNGKAEVEAGADAADRLVVA